LAHTCLRAGIAVVVLASVAGVYPRAFLIAAPLWLWADRHLARWRARPAENQSGPLVVRLTLAVLLTIAAAYAHHGWELLHDRPGGGCGTAIVPEGPCGPS